MKDVRNATRAIRDYWNGRPVGTGDVPTDLPVGSPEFFETLDHRRYELEPVERIARFDAWRGRRVLEIGCGTGGDLARFGRAGAHAVGVDLSERSVTLTGRRLAGAGLPLRACVADAERLPFADGRFDLVYSWGVLHHAADLARTIREARRVLGEHGTAVVMLYNRRSTFALQLWVRYALLRGRPFTSIAAVVSRHLESPGTRAVTSGEAQRLFTDAGFSGVSVEPIRTPWDLRLGRRWFAPSWLRRMIPARFGWFLIIRART